VRYSKINEEAAMMHIERCQKIRLICVVVLFVLYSVVFSGCGSNGNNQETSPTSGTITVYTAIESELVTQFLEAFNTRYPDITVNIVRDSTGIITARLIAESNNPQADIVWGTAASSMMVLESMSMLEPYAPQGLERILPMFRDEQEIPAWVGITAWETAFIVNTIELERLELSIDDIRCYEDLLRPELAGHIVMPHPASSGTGFLTVTAILQLFDRYTDAGWAFFDRLHENISQYTHSGSAPATMAATGETVIGISFGYAGILQVQRGAPVEIIWPTLGSGWDMEANALIAKDSIHPAAKTFLDWAISDEAMSLYNESFPIIATGGGDNIAGYAGNPVDQLIENDFVWIAENRAEILDHWAERY